MTGSRRDESICFFLPYARDIRDKDPHTDWEWFTNGATVWVGITFHLLRARGLPVVLRSDAPTERVVVVHRDHVGALEQLLPRRVRPFVVVARADRSPHPGADVEIVQNPTLRVSERKHYVSHWPQPGLVPRDASRGDRIEEITFKGNPDNLHRAFADPSWTRRLAARGIRWMPDFSVQRTGGVDRSYRAAWNDYSRADLHLAVRPDLDNPYLERPTHKLVNAWRAGTPLIAGPESAFVALRRSELDFVLVRDPGEVLDQVSALAADPGRYRAMIENGYRRAEEFIFDSVADQWERLLWDRLVPMALNGESGLVRASRRKGRRIVSIANNRIPASRRLVSLW